MILGKFTSMENTNLFNSILDPEFIKTLERLFLFVQTKPGAEKISFKSFKIDEHYTIRYWSRKKTVDLHRTNELTNEKVTIFEISTFRLLLLVGRVNRVQEFLTKEIWLKRKVNPGKLKRCKCILVDLNDEDIRQEDFLKVAGGKKLRFKKGFDPIEISERLNYFSPDILKERSHGIFSVLKYKSGRWLYEGLVFKVPNHKGSHFVTKKAFNLQSKLTMVAIYNLTSQVSFDKKEEVVAYLRKLLSEKYKYMLWRN